MAQKSDNVRWNVWVGHLTHTTRTENKKRRLYHSDSIGIRSVSIIDIQIQGSPLTKDFNPNGAILDGFLLF